MWYKLLPEAEVLQDQVLQGQDLQAEVQHLLQADQLLRPGPDVLCPSADVLCAGPDLLRPGRLVRCSGQRWRNRCSSAAGGSPGSGTGPQGLVRAT
jgi:hypothetical protein